MGGKAFRKIKARIPCSHLARSHSLGPLFPRSLRPTLPKRRSTNQQRKSRAKKIKEIRRALLPLTYILPSARGGPAADGSCSAEGDTGLTAQPAPPADEAERQRDTPETRCGARPSHHRPSRLPPQQDQPLPGAGGGGKFSPGRGLAGSTPSPPKPPAPGRKKGKREGGGHPGKSPSATGQRGRR